MLCCLAALGCCWWLITPKTTWMTLNCVLVTRTQTYRHIHTHTHSHTYKHAAHIFSQVDPHVPSSILSCGCLYVRLCLRSLCVCVCVCVCVWGGVTFPVSRTTACLIFPLSSSQQRNLTLQGLSLLSSRSILSLKCGCSCLCVCARMRKLSGGINKCVLCTLGWKRVKCTFPPSSHLLL